MSVFHDTVALSTSSGSNADCTPMFEMFGAATFALHGCGSVTLPCPSSVKSTSRGRRSAPAERRLYPNSVENSDTSAVVSASNRNAAARAPSVSVVSELLSFDRSPQPKLNWYV